MPNYLIPAHPAPPITRTTRTPPPALPKKSASVSQVSGLFAGKSGSPSRYPHQRPQPGIPMPAGLKGPQMPGTTRDQNAQWKNLQPGFNPPNVSFCFTFLFLRKRLSCVRRQNPCLERKLLAVNWIPWSRFSLFKLWNFKGLTAGKSLNFSKEKLTGFSAKLSFGFAGSGKR